MAELTLNPSTTALVLIDLEQGIVSRPLAPHSGQEVVAQANRLIEALRPKEVSIVFVHVLLHEIFKLNSDSPMGDPNAPTPPASASGLVPELRIQPEDVLITKRQWGAFYGTNLDLQLRRRGIKTIVICGIATNFGVESTARDGIDRGYDLVFVEDAMTSATDEAHRFSTEFTFPKMGRVRSADEVIAAFA